MAIRVVHLINCLSVGGAERTLLRLLAACDRSRFEPAVVTLLERNALRPEVEALGIPVRCVGLRSERPGPVALLRLASALRELRPDLVQSWLYYANAAAIGARPLTGRSFPVVWNVRQSVDDLSREPPLLRAAIRLGAALSRRPAAVVNNSRRSSEQHRALGFRPRREEIIPNGLDVERFPCGAAARAAARQALDLPDDVLAVAVAGRAHPMKDHLGFIAAAAMVARARDDARFLLFGRGLEGGGGPLVSAVASHGLGERVRFFGERLDLPELYAGLDVVVSSSAWGEGFPNVVAEAMAAGVPVVATDVGDTRELVGEAGTVVAPRHPAALAAAIEALLALTPEERQATGLAGRQRIAGLFSAEATARRYEALWAELARPA